jgi:hypothetical protein
MGMKKIASYGLVILIISVGFAYGNLKLVDNRTTRDVDNAWEAFQNYLDYAEAHDLEKLATVSHQVSEVCKNPETQAECFARMDMAVAYGREFEKEQFTTIWRDKKQIILLTDWQIEENDLIKAYGRREIYFTKHNKTGHKVLSFSMPYNTISVLKIGRTAEQVDAEIERMITDSDMDGLDDQLETCAHASAGSDCTETDPYRRDTHGDGWWDGVRALFY